MLQKSERGLGRETRAGAAPNRGVHSPSLLKIGLKGGWEGRQGPGRLPIGECTHPPAAASDEAGQET